MIQKRGGHLCAPIPQDGIGKCGYLNDMPYEMLKSSLAKYKQICFDFPRQGKLFSSNLSEIIWFFYKLVQIVLNQIGMILSRFV